jgi:hypothetical protein
VSSAGHVPVENIWRRLLNPVVGQQEPAEWPRRRRQCRVRDSGAHPPAGRTTYVGSPSRRCSNTTAVPCRPGRYYNWYIVYPCLSSWFYTTSTCVHECVFLNCLLKSLCVLNLLLRQCMAGIGGRSFSTNGSSACF